MFIGSRMMMKTSAAVTYATWNPADKAANITLSGGNLVATVGTGGAYVGVRSTISKSSGKWYCEIKVNTNIDGFIFIGIANSTAPLTFPGVDTNGQGYQATSGQYLYNNAVVANWATYTTNDIIGLALDASNGNTQVYKNNVLQGTMNSTISGPYYIMFGAYGATDAVIANFGATALTYSPPAGYNAGLYQ